MTAVVVGGGIGGLAAAVALRRVGREVVVAERAARIGGGGAGLVLYPNGVKALDALGLGAAVRAAGHIAVEGRPVLTPSGEVLAVDPVGAMEDRFGAPQVALLRTALHRLLREEAARSGVLLHDGAAVTGHHDRDGRVEAVLSGGDRLRGDVLVGADGIGSGVRRRLLRDGRPRYLGYSTVRGRSPVLGHPHGFMVVGGLDLFAAPVGGGLLYWTAKIPAREGEWPARGGVGAHRELLRRLSGWHGGLVEVVGAADAGSVVVADVHDRDPAGRWSLGRVTLLGDAAHPMAPALGQGAGMALEDAVTLASCLAEADGAPAALARYAGLRAPRTSAVVRLSRGRGPSGRSYSSRDAEVSALFGWSPPVLPGPVNR